MLSIKTRMTSFRGNSLRGLQIAIRPSKIENPIAGVVQWQNGSFPSCIRGFDSPHPLAPQRAKMVDIDTSVDDQNLPNEA
jgi:hypothetical protein